MSLVELNRDPSIRQLRQFGCIAMAVLPAVGWWWGASAILLKTLAAVGIVCGALAFTRPKALKPLFVGLGLITLPIGLVFGELMLFALFCLVFVPMGLVFRLIGRDALQRKLEPNAKTYWQPKAQPSGPASYLNQW